MKGDYEKIVVINQEYAEIHIKKDALKNPDYKDLFGTTLVGQPSPEASFYKYNIGNFEHFDKELEVIEEQTGKHVSYEIEKRSNAWKDILVIFGPFLLLILFFVIMARNLADCRYELSSGYPMPGRSFYGEVDFRF